MRNLGVAQVTEVDLKLLIRMLSGVGAEENYENDKRVSKSNCGSRKGCSIKSELLKKRLIIDLAKTARESFVHAMPDSESHRYRKMHNTGGVVEEFIGVRT